METALRTYNVQLKSLSVSGLTFMRCAAAGLWLVAVAVFATAVWRRPNSRDCKHGGQRIDSVQFNFHFVCNCTNTRFTGDNCEIPNEVSVADNDNDATILASVMAFVLVAICGLLIFVWLRQRHYRLKATDFEETMLRWIDSGAIDIQDPATVTANNLPREIKRAHTTLVNPIGSGAFGDVFLGKLAEPGTPSHMVAIKTVKEDASDEGIDDLLKEALVMSMVPSHSNLIDLIGVVTTGMPKLMLISFCQHGSLQSYLQKQGTRINFTSKLHMALDIARGMAHLMQHQFVHRDLAARNVLVDLDLTCRVSDFGLSRNVQASIREDADDGDEYYASKNGKFPVRWTAPEAAETGKFSQQTDVWSYGITMTEIFNNGLRPYNDMQTKHVLDYVRCGNTHPRQVYAAS